MTELRNLNIVSPVNPEGHVQVDVEDYNDKLIDNYFLEELGDAAPLQVQPPVSGQYPASFNYTVIVTTGVFSATPLGAGLKPEELVLIDVAGDVFFHATVQTCVQNTPAGFDTLTIDKPIDHIFPTGTTLVKRVNSDMLVNGSVTPRTFALSGGVADSHVNRIILTIQCDSEPFGNLFGDTTALTNGLLLRQWNGTDYTIFNWKTNADIRNSCYDVDVSQGTVGPSGKWSLTARITFNAKDKHGSTIEIGTGEQLQVIVRDDLSAMLSGPTNVEFMRIMAQGHFHTHNP
jgi:hypothetical protein